MTTPVLAELTVGQELARREITVDRARLVRYAGASGDFNPIHWNERVATAVGLPGVIAHGMWTMGAASSVVADWAGDPGAVVDYQVRFTRPVPVPDPGAATVEVVAVAGAIDADAGTVRVDLTVSGGVACYGVDGRDWNGLLSAADDALYAAKNGGRNHIRAAAAGASAGAWPGARATSWTPTCWTASSRRWRRPKGPSGSMSPRRRT